MIAARRSFGFGWTPKGNDREFLLLRAVFGNMSFGSSRPEQQLRPPPEGRRSRELERNRADTFDRYVDDYEDLTQEHREGRSE